jgi:glycosyltransferase involved in cell wall biosynthesis
MKVSIVTPSFNQAQYLSETMDSVLGQNYPEIEYIVMDGGSTDGSVEIIKKHAARLAHWESAPDKGQADAINRGLARATGEIVAYLNSDDALAPGAVRAIVEGFRAHPGAGVVYGGTEKIDDDGQVVKPKFITPYSRDLLKTFCLVPQPSSFYSRAAWDQCGPFNPELHFVLDWDFLLKVADRFPIVAIDELISRFRVYQTTKSSAGGWPRLREIADTGRKYNGALDYNYVVYTALRAASTLEKPFVGNSKGPLRQLVMKLALTFKDGRHFMLHDNA